MNITAISTHASPHALACKRRIPLKTCSLEAGVRERIGLASQLGNAIHGRVPATRAAEIYSPLLNLAVGFGADTGDWTVALTFWNHWKECADMSGVWAVGISSE